MESEMTTPKLEELVRVEPIEDRRCIIIDEWALLMEPAHYVPIVVDDIRAAIQSYADGQMAGLREENATLRELLAECVAWLEQYADNNDLQRASYVRKESLHREYNQWDATLPGDFDKETAQLRDLAARVKAKLDRGKQTGGESCDPK